MKLYNSLTRSKHIFDHPKDKPVKLYVCGITPYDTTHLGHAFTYIFFDVLVRYLQFQGYHVEYLQNVTDIDDDILQKAREQNTDWKKLGEFWTNRFLTDMRNLNVQKPTYYVKATDSIPTIITLVQTLLKKGFAYESEGNIYYDIAKDPEYGKLSHYTEKQMMILSKERGANPEDPRKKHPLDFILWQLSLPDEPSWNFPMPSGNSGSSVSSSTSVIKGRPGWHIECSAMIKQYLGDQITLHGGGRDLIFPHHESEIAQSEAATGKRPFVQFWLHTGMVMYEGEKMAKSLGNLVLASDLLQKYHPNVIRYVLLSHHYRSPWEFQDSELDEAKEKVQTLEKAIKLPTDETKKFSTSRCMELFLEALDDDINTPEALKCMQEVAEKIQRHPAKKLQEILKKEMEILGFTIK